MLFAVLVPTRPWRYLKSGPFTGSSSCLGGMFFARALDTSNTDTFVKARSLRRRRGFVVPLAVCEQYVRRFDLHPCKGFSTVILR